jgi:hypothetical protein
MTLAGRLGASSSAFTGPLRCDRPDLSFLRHSLAPGGGRAPLRYLSPEHEVSLASTDPTSPRYLDLDDNNGAAALAAGERDRPPGASAARGPAVAELRERTGEFLPLGLVAEHRDRACMDLHRMKGIGT